MPELHESVRTLLSDLGLVPVAVDPVSTPGADWGFVCKYPSATSDVALLVVHPVQKQYVVVQVALGVSESHRGIIRALGDSAYRDFEFAMLRDLLVFGQAQFRAEFDHEKRDLSRVLLSNRVWLEGLSLQHLDHALQRVFDVLLLAKAHVRHVIGEVA